MRNHRRRILALAGALLAVVAALGVWRWEAGAPERAYRDNARLQFELCMIAPHADTAACLAEYTATLEAWPTLRK
jgi:hypothetical protein